MDLPPDPDRITVSSFDDKNWLFFFFLIFQLSVLVSNADDSTGRTFTL
jgi:hypothetical protein